LINKVLHSREHLYAIAGLILDCIVEQPDPAGTQNRNPDVIATHYIPADIDVISSEVVDTDPVAIVAESVLVDIHDIRVLYDFDPVKGVFHGVMVNPVIGTATVMC
jgi:hypothetical protein